MVLVASHLMVDEVISLRQQGVTAGVLSSQSSIASMIPERIVAGNSHS